MSSLLQKLLAQGAAALHLGASTPATIATDAGKIGPVLASGAAEVEGVADKLVADYQKAKPMVDELVSAFQGKGVEAELAGELASLALSTIGTHQVQAAQAVAPSSEAPVAEQPQGG